MSETSIEQGRVFCTQTGDYCPQTAILNRIELAVKANAKDTADIKQWLQGDPKQPSNPGVLMRLDRLEQDHEKNKWLARTALGAAIAAGLSALASMFKH